MVPSRCCGRWPKPVRNFTVIRSRKPFTNRRTPYLERPQRRGLAKIPPKTNTVHPGLVPGKLLDDLPGAVAAAVVDKNRLDLQRRLACGFFDLCTQDLQTLSLVV